MVGRDDMVVLYYDGIRHTFRISERFGFLTALDEEMRRCALMIDKTKRIEELPESDFEVMEDPVYSFEANERVLRYTLLDSFDLSESSREKSELKIESDEEEELEKQENKLEASEESEESESQDTNDKKSENEDESEIELGSEIEVGSENCENFENRSENEVVSEQKDLKENTDKTEPSDFHDIIEKKEEIINESEDEDIKNRFLYINNKFIQAVIRWNDNTVVIRQIPLKNIFQIIANRENRTLIFKYEYKSKVCNCCYHCEQVQIRVSFHFFSSTPSLIRFSFSVPRCFISCPSLYYREHRFASEPVIITLPTLLTCIPIPFLSF